MKVNYLILLLSAVLLWPAPVLADAKAAAPVLPPYSYTNAQGENVTLAFPAGSKTLLHFWATWCVPCVKELPLLDQLAGQLQQNEPNEWRVIAVSLDSNATAVKTFLQRHNIKNLGADIDLTLQAMRALKIGGLPTTLIIDDQGRELKRYVGDYDWTTFNPADLSVAEPKPLY